MWIKVLISALFCLVVSAAGPASAETLIFHNFQADVPSSWTVLSQTVTEDRQATLVKFASADQKIHLAVNVENTANPGAAEVSRLVEIYGGSRVFKPFKLCGDGGFHQRNPGGGWLALCPLGSHKIMSLILDGRETREVARLVSSIGEIAPQPSSAPPAPPAKQRKDKARKEVRTSR